MKTFTFSNLGRRHPWQNMTKSALLLVGMLSVPPAVAVELSENVQLHGFASQAYVSTTANRFFGPSDSGSFDFRELGVNLSWLARPNLQFAAQLGSRKAGGTEVNARPRFDYALVDYTFYNSEDNRGGVRVGRHRIPLGFYNLTRDVANARPSIFLPESVYYDQSRSLLLALDGGQLYGETRTSIGDFFLEVGAGNLILDSKAKETSKATTSYAGRLLYERDGGRLRLALSRIEANLDIYQRPFPNAKANYRFSYILSGQYNAEKWSLTGEWSPEVKSTLSGFIVQPVPGFVIRVPDIKQTGEGYYLQGAYRFLPGWEALLRYDVLYNDKKDKSGTTYAGLGGLPRYNNFAKDKTVGLAWNVRRDTKIRAEYHWVNGTAYLSGRENLNAQNTRQYWEMFALQASYSF
ncbi:MAG TPA: porin [Gallionella sp.]|nr:porin [Gallionella sp.]